MPPFGDSVLNCLLSRRAGAGRAAYLQMIDDLLAAGIFLRNAHRFLALFLAAHRAVQFDGFATGVHRYSRQIALRKSGLNLALEIRTVGIALRQCRSGTRRASR